MCWNGRSKILYLTYLNEGGWGVACSQEKVPGGVWP